MNLDLLQKTVKAHTGADAFLVMPATTRDALRAAYPSPSDPYAGPNSIMLMMSLPVVVDSGCEVAWRLVDRRTGDVLVSDAS